MFTAPMVTYVARRYSQGRPVVKTGDSQMNDRLPIEWTRGSNGLMYVTWGILAAVILTFLPEKLIGKYKH